jgi:hypothetical protein|tara:strand:- start:42 stop:314 length:273 start_codon:yes stop_codon:yes gene_type:complete
MKNFLVKIYAYHYKMEITITSMDGPLDIENAIIDKLGKGDIKWEYLGEMYDPRVKRITYEEVIDGENDATSTRPLSQEEGSRSGVGTGAS